MLPALVGFSLLTMNPPNTDVSHCSPICACQCNVSLYIYGSNIFLDFSEIVEFDPIPLAGT